MIFLAVLLTLLAGAAGAFVEPLSLSVALPVSVMGAFILYALKHEDER